MTDNSTTFSPCPTGCLQAGPNVYLNVEYTASSSFWSRFCGKMIVILGNNVA